MIGSRFKGQKPDLVSAYVEKIQLIHSTVIYTHIQFVFILSIADVILGTNGKIGFYHIRFKIEFGKD